MFYRDALERCSALGSEIASLLCDLGSAAPQRAAAWTSVAAEERRKAGLLHAAAELSAALGDDGPFLVEVPVQIATLRQVVDRIREQLTNPPDVLTAVALAETLESARREELYDGLLEVVEDEMRRVLRLIEIQTRQTRDVRYGRGPKRRRRMRARDKANPEDTAMRSFQTLLV